jgi:hypothetical protein
MKLLTFAWILVVAIVAGCSTTSRSRSHAGTTHIAVSGTAGSVFTGVYGQDGRQILISNSVPWSVDIPRLSSLTIKTSPDSGVVLDLLYEDVNNTSRIQQPLGAGMSIRVRVRNGFETSIFKY